MSINEDTLRVLDQYRLQVMQLTDGTTRALVQAWTTAWDDVANELEQALLDLTTAARDGRLTRTQVARHSRLSAALDIIGARLTEVSAQSGVVIVGSLPTAVDLGGVSVQQLLATQMPPGQLALVIGWNRVDPVAVQAIIDRTAGRITAATLPLGPEGQAAIRRHLVRGLVVGDNPRTTARRILTETQALFEGGYARAERIARTETLDAHRAAAQASMAANQDVVKGWEWVATLGPRTCPACWAMHGQSFPVGTAGPEGHPNCRCTSVPVTKSWAELGFVGIEEPPSLLPDAAATFAALTPGEQRSILGRARFDAWQAGTYPLGSWAVKRPNADWRASWVVSPVPAAA